MGDDKFIVNIEKNQKLTELYYQIINYFYQQYPNAVISHTKSYVGIKFKGGHNKCWFQTSDLYSLDFKFRKNPNEKSLEDNVISYRINDFKAFQELIPLINEKMKEIQPSKVEPYKNRVSLIDIQNDDSDVVKIYSIGSCNPQTRLGRYTALLQYKSHFKVVDGDLRDTTANRCIITGLIEAVKLLKKPCRVNLITSTSIGVNKVIKNDKGTNADIVRILLNILAEKQCDRSFIVVQGEGEELNEFIFSKT
ncbi:MAG TPA: hypothetical protein GX523_08260 [Desulfitobacterium dehalogenans]|uniref:RNase H type-1 domain-containing protein n=1 Tax=Desulfitobacterium dehalogenans TaxID=36854 RepID=A0A7C6Z480_9FIRM|nr:hypothetical protein [Desulfitobacterium dehalogenans]